MTVGTLKISGIDVRYTLTQGQEFELESSDVSWIAVKEVFEALQGSIDDEPTRAEIYICLNMPEEGVYLFAEDMDHDRRVRFEAFCEAGRISSDEEFLEMLDAALWRIRAKRAGRPRYYGPSYGVPANYVFYFTVPGDVPVGLIVEALESLRESVYYPPSAVSSPPSVQKLIRSGQPHAVLGLPECDWLDAKGAVYEKSSKGHVELARDVASFANSRAGGIILIGFSTEIVDGKETIASLAPVPPNPSLPDAYRKTVDERVYPPITGFEICYLNVTGGALAAIIVPPQPEENKPYLVQGGVIDGGKYDGNTISIVQRRGDGTLHTRPAAIHADLSAARMARRKESLRRNEMTS